MESLRRRWSRRTRNESCFGNLRLVRQDGASRDQLTLSDLQFLKEFKNKELRTQGKCDWNCFKFFCSLNMRNPRGDTLGIFGRGCATGTLEPLAYTRARSSEFCYPIIDLSPKIPPPLSQSFPETTDVSNTVQPKQNRFDFFIFLSGNSRFP